MIGTFTPADPRYTPVPMSATVVVYPAPLVIKANDLRTAYRKPLLPPFTSTVTGFVNYETLGVTERLAGPHVGRRGGLASRQLRDYAVGRVVDQLCDHVRAGAR